MDIEDNRSEVAESLWREMDKLDAGYKVWYDDDSASIHRAPVHKLSLSLWLRLLIFLRLINDGPHEFEVNIDDKKAKITVLCSHRYVDPDALKKNGYNKEFLDKLSAFLEQKGFTVSATLEDDC